MVDLTRREAAIAAAAACSLAVGSMPSYAAAEAARIGEPDTNPLSHVHPELRPAIEAFMELLAKPSDEKGKSLFAPPPDQAVSWTMRRIPGSRGSPEVVVYVINAGPGRVRPAILHTHGGGFVAGAAKDSIASMQKVAAALDCIVVTVDYRLAPAVTWQGSVEDNYAGLRWLHAHAEEIGVDRSRIALMGESAGGGHAALLAIAARDRGEIPVAFQCLTYPMLDDRTGSGAPIPSFIGALGWTPALNRNGWRSFLGMEPGGASVPRAAVPSRTADLSGLPPTWIGVGGIDLFVGEDIEYARHLLMSGVATELVVVPGGFHGFDALPDALGKPAPVSDQFNKARLNALRRAFGQQVVA